MTPVTKFTLAYAAYVAAIHAVRGPWVNWSRGAVLDNWTLTHIIWSQIGRRMGVTLKEMTALSVANEVGEAIIRRTRPDLMFGEHESPANIVADVAANVVGWHLG